MASDTQSRPRLLLTGSEGNIATSTLKPNLEKHYDIVGFDLVIGDDILDPDCIARKMEGIDYVIHTAAVANPRSTDPSIYQKVNFEGSRNILEGAKNAGVKRVVFFSSFSRYGPDSWMRERYETGPITGDDVAIPKYLPIDEEHPSILEYENLSEWGGKWYGRSKAEVENLGAEMSSDDFSFVALRLCGFMKLSEKYLRQKALLIDEARRGIANGRKQHVYGRAACTTPELLIASLLATLGSKSLANYEAFNAATTWSGLEDVVRAYFPENTVTDQIFCGEKIKKFLNQEGYEYKMPKVENPEQVSLLKKVVRKLRS